MVDSPAQDVVPWKDNNSVDVEVVPSIWCDPNNLKLVANYGQTSMNNSWTIAVDTPS